MSVVTARFNFLVPLVLLTLALAGCAGEGGDSDGSDGNGGGNGNQECVPPDEPAISFAQNIAPLWAARCALPSCHTSSFPAAGLNLEAAASYDATVGVDSTQNPNLVLIEPGERSDSYLWRKSDPAGDLPIVGAVMPLNCPTERPCLSQTELDAIGTWIDECALNN
jgi:hypothetical protein